MTVEVSNTDQLGQLGGPRVGGDDSLLGDPVFVHGAQRLDGHLTFVGFVPADQDAVGLFKIPHRRSLSQELGVGQNLRRQHKHCMDAQLCGAAPARVSPSWSDTHVEVEAGLGVGVKYSPDALGSADGDGALLRDDLVALGHLDDPPGARLNELQVGSPALPHPIGLCGCVHLEWIHSHVSIRATGSSAAFIHSLP